VLDVNQAGCELNGLDRAQLIGKKCAGRLDSAGPPRPGPPGFQETGGGKIGPGVEGESLRKTARRPGGGARGPRGYNGRARPAAARPRHHATPQRRGAALQSSEMLFRSVWENSVDGMAADG